MDQDRDNAPQEKKPQSSSNFVWYMLGIGVMVLLVVTIWGSGNGLDLKWHEFEKLVLASNPDVPENKQHVDIELGTGSKQSRFRISRMTDLEVGNTEITGTVHKASLGDAAAAAEAPADSESVPQSRVEKSSNVSFRVARLPSEQATIALLRENQIPFDFAEGPNAMIGYLPIFVLTGLFILLFVMMVRRVGGAGSPMAFGRSRGKLYAQEDIEITFDDVAGIEEAVDELREVVEFLKTPEKFQALGGRIPKGVLLIGPPGTGKTLLAKAIAGEAGVPFYSLSGSDFVEMFVGVGAARVRDMFQQAEQRAPCIIFIDELDALGKTRGSGNIGGHDEREQTLNALLVEMDGFGTNSGVIVMAATNRPETLDPALLRPGRFDRHVLVDRPDVAGREEILNVHLREIKVDADVNVKALAAITSGFVGADLANMVNEAALLAAREGKKTVTMEEFNEAVERNSAGLEKKKRIMQQEEKLRVAYHESGHALVAYSLPNTDPVHKVSIIPRGLAALGYTMQRPEQDRFLMTQCELESQIQILLAGTIAEELVFSDVSSGAQNDLERATAIARSMVMDYGMSRLGRVNYRASNRSPFLATTHDVPSVQTHSEETAREIDEEVRRIVADSLGKTREILQRRKDALVAVSEALMEKEVIESQELARIIEEHSPGPILAAGTDVDLREARSPKSVSGSDPESEAADGS